VKAKLPDAARRNVRGNEFRIAAQRQRGKSLRIIWELPLLNCCRFT